MISSVLTKPSTGLLSFSIISALWIFSQSIAYLQKAYNKSYGVEKERGIIWGRLFSFLISFALQGLVWTLADPFHVWENDRSLSLSDLFI